MPWTWDPDKNRTNQRKHGLSFDTAQLVFDDPLAVSRLDASSDEERWQTVGMVADVVLFVVHTALEAADDGEQPVGRIISARKATARERKAYEEGAF
ncbi:MAG: BrnT family toxin [Alphaproteobacteria bacterium]|nr:BrnT family toxin [Alphaproteobacteria bacterium]